MKNGIIMAIGGNEQKHGPAPLLRAFVERAGGAEGRLAIIPSASAKPELRAKQYERLFRRLGAEHVYSVHAERDVTRDELLLLTNATGIFVTGGDQLLLMQHLRRTGCDAAIVEAVANGAVYAGTSAGSAVISEVMLYGDEEGGVYFGDGLGLMPNVIVDQHFTERDRMLRLVYAAKRHGLVGVGIDEDTAMVWDREGRAHVVGRGAVTLVQPERGSVELITLRP